MPLFACLDEQVPPDAVLVYDLELVDYTNAKESYEMSNEEKVGAVCVCVLVHMRVCAVVRSPHIAAIL